jgi:hypothetical protein
MTTPVPSTNHPDVLLVGAGIMIQVFERRFAEKLKAGDGLAKLKEVIPSYGQSLAESAALCQPVNEKL